MFAPVLPAGRDRRGGGRPSDRHLGELRDRVGAAFPVAPAAGCRNTVFNAVPQSATEYVPKCLPSACGDSGSNSSGRPRARSAPSPRPTAPGSTGADGRDTWLAVRARNQHGVTRGTLQFV